MYIEKVLVVVLFVIIASSSFAPTAPAPNPVPYAEAQGLQLRVSAAEDPRFQNHFFGPQIVQVIIDDPGAIDPDSATVGLRVRGVDVGRVHLTDGLWYHFFAEEDSFGILMDVMSDGVRDNIVFVANPVLDAPPVGSNLPVFTIGTAAYIQVPGNQDSFISEITTIGTTNFVELDQGDIMPTLPNAFCDNVLLGSPCPVGNTNPDLNIRGDTITESSVPGDNIYTNPGSPFPAPFFNREDIDWPYIQLLGIEESDIVNIRAGSASVNLTYKEQRDTISATLDRSTDYPLFAEVINSYTDFMWNINPAEEDAVFFVLSKTSGSPDAILYNPVRNFDPAGQGLIRSGANGRNIPNLLPVLFRPNLQFDNRQLLELDLEGMNTLKFNEFLSLGPNGVLDPSTSYVPGDDSFGFFAQPRTAGNSFLLDTSPFAAGADVAAWRAGGLVRLPVIQMIESDPNTSFFESIDEQAGSRAGVFTGANDKVANYDYFDIVNSAPMTSHDGFATVDMGVYNSGDRAIFTTTDADQNLRSRVSEQPSAVDSNTFMKVGDPFPLGNNPTFESFFGKNTLSNAGNAASVNMFDFEGGGSADVYGPDGLLGTFDDLPLASREGIEQAVFILVFDIDDVADGVVDGLASPVAAPSTIKAAAEGELNLGTGGGTFVSVSTGAGSAITPGFPALALPAGVAAVIRIDATPSSAEIVSLDLDNDGLVETNGSINTGEAVFIASTGRIMETNPQRSQKIGLDFSTGLVGGDRPSGIVLNSLVNLQDLAEFTEYTATGTQIRGNGIGAPVPTGQAFAVDPFVAATSIWTTTLVGPPAPGTTFTHGGANVDSSQSVLGRGLLPDALPGSTVFRVMQPRYNLIALDLSELATERELLTGDSFNSVAVQIKVDDGGAGAGRDVVSRLVDFTPFDPSDVTTPGAPFMVGMAGQTKIGVGSFRIADFLAQDWDDDGLFWPNDANEPYSTLNIQVSIVFVDTNTSVDPPQNEPVEVIVPGNHLGTVDFSGLSIALPPSVVPGLAPEFPAGRTIDEIRLLASENAVYRVQVIEQGMNSSIFNGRADFMTANQFDTTARALADMVLSGNPVKAFIPNSFLSPDKLSFAYTDIDIVQAFRPVSAPFEYRTIDGSIRWDKSSYSFGQDAFLTLDDRDLNRRQDATERYELPTAGFVWFELGTQRAVDNADRILLRGSFITSVDSSFLEISPDAGTFISQITIPGAIVVSTASGDDNIQGTFDSGETVASVPTDGLDLKAHYQDVRDTSSVEREFHDATHIGSGPTEPAVCERSKATLVGTEGDDILIGTDGDDIIIGLGGNDLIIDRLGNDVICGGDGNDFVFGGRGDDLLFGGKGDDVLLGGEGSDDLFGGQGDDRLFGDDGGDRLYGLEGNDVIVGGAGDDIILGDIGDDDADGGVGIDKIYGGLGNDQLSGGDDDDELFGNDGDDELNGGEGNDLLVGADGDDELNGGAGNDKCQKGETITSCP